MGSAYTVSPSALHDHDNNPEQQPSTLSKEITPQPRDTSATGGGPKDFSPLLSRADSESLSPPVAHFTTPAGSANTPGHYQPSDYSDFDTDPFFGLNFSNLDGGTPSFLDGHVDWNPPTGFTDLDNPELNGAHPGLGDGSSYPLTPEQTASIHTTSPRSELIAGRLQKEPGRLPASISPQELQKPFKSESLVAETSQLTPSLSNSSRSSEDGRPPASAAMNCQSPRVTVSVWDHDNISPTHTIERTFEEPSAPVRPGIDSAGDLISSGGNVNHSHVPRDDGGRWQPDSRTGQSGLGPQHRMSDEVPSINEAASSRKLRERNESVGSWLNENLDDVSAPKESTPDQIAAIEQSREDTDDIPLGSHTENRLQPGQTYFDGPGGSWTEVDQEIIAGDRNWTNPPLLPHIQTGVPGRYQPESSQAAIERFERLCRDNDSILSRAATWGTRRRSHPSVFDVEGVTSGSFLKKLSINRSGGDSGGIGNIITNIRGRLNRRPSASSILKRTRSRSRSRDGDREEHLEHDATGLKSESTSRLVPPMRTSSGRKASGSFITSALVSMGSNAASIGTTHARSGSISGGSVTSPKSPLGGIGSSLSVKNTLKRPRSKSEIPKPTLNTGAAEPQPGLVDMWKGTGGPSVAYMAKPNAEQDEDEEEDEDFYDDNDMKADANLIDDVVPNFAGFQQHVVALNPSLAGSSNYLVDRIAHQQIIRYKHLLTMTVRHLRLGANCPCGTLCIALGGTANVLDQKGDAKDLDPLATHFEDDDVPQMEGAVNQDSFPQDIPMPPTQYLPAEFECQLCFQRKKFQKPSDWTKHVHEDVQPFTCTWDKCREPKIFKRKADWVRHENEGHRHLEWWTCDVDECRHTCYRRDNFLQHLVREHKYPEPRVKTKAAMKKAGGGDPTWQKVEQCHMETTQRPQEEPCRFCGKVFPTWKKLTVHLAKHMEQVALPVLRLARAKAKEIDADTIISPVQDPPPRPMIPLPTNHSPNMVHYSGNGQEHIQTTPQNSAYPNQGPFMYPVMPTAQFQQQYLSTGYDNLGQQMQQNSMGMGPLNQGYNHSPQMQDIPVTSGPFNVHGQQQYMTVPSNGLEPFPQLNALGLQNVPVPSVGPQITYDGMMDPSRGTSSPFSAQGSASPYMQSPHQGHGNQERGWSEGRHQGFH